MIYNIPFKKKLLLFIFLLSSLISPAQKTVSCLIETALGNIQVELYKEKAPLTVANFLNYVSHDLYTNSSFFRVCTAENEADRKIRIQVIQGGDVAMEKQFDPIKLETTKETGLLHKKGTISMARSEPDSATSSFFICVNDEPELDHGGKRNPDGMGFAAFGKVTKGMDVVKAIQSQTEEDQFLIEPVMIRSIVKLEH